MAQKIEISVIIPNYNYGQYIEECISSVLASDFNHAQLEIVVVDDASTDNSIQVINKIKEEADIQINLIKNKTNQGLAKTRNNGIKAAKGKYLFFLDSDNYINVDCLTKHHAFLSSHKEYSACYAPIQRFDCETKELTGVFSNEPYDYNRLAYGNYIDAMAMIKKKDLLEIGPYDEQMPYSGWEDYDLWLRMGVNNKKVHFIEGEPLTQYRVHKSSMINSIPIHNQEKLRTYINTKFNLGYFNHNPNISEDLLYPLKDITVQFFWGSVDFGFSEENSIKQNVNVFPGAALTKLDVPPLAESVNFIRFDIGNKPGLLVIHYIYIRDKNGEIKWEWNKYAILHQKNLLLLQNRMHWPDKVIQLSTSIDPWFIIETTDKLNELSSQGFIVEILFSNPSRQHLEVLNTEISPFSNISEAQYLKLEQHIHQLDTEKNDVLVELKHNNEILEDLKEHTILLKQSLEQQKVENIDLRNDKVLLSSEINLKNELLNKALNEKETLEQKDKAIAEQINEVSNNARMLKQQLQQFEESLAKERTKNSENKEERAILVSEIELKNKLLSKFLENKELIELQQTELKQNINLLTQEKEALISTRESITLEAERSAAFIKELQQSSEKQSIELANNKKTLQNYISENITLSSNLDKRSVKIEALEHELTAAAKTILEAKQQKEELLSRFNLIEEKLDDHIEMHKDLLKTYAKAGTELRDALKHNDELASKIDELNGKINDYQNKIANYYEMYDSKTSIQIALKRILKK